MSRISSVREQLLQQKYNIYHLYVEENKTVSDTLNILHAQNIKCSRSSFMKYIKEWQFNKHEFTQDTSSLRVELAFLFWKKCLSDKKILRVSIKATVY